jgi:RND family efflux transporter MFP subunit
MKKIFFAMIFGIVLLSCDRNHEHNHAGEVEDKIQENPNVIHFEIQQQKRIVFATELPRVEVFGQVIKATAQVQSSPADEVIISARITGIVFLSGKNWTEGQPVNAGQPLFVLSGSGLAENNSRTRFTEARTNYQKAESDYKRAQELIEEKIIAEKDFIQIKTDYEKAKSLYDDLLQNFTAQGQKISAPLSGYIKQVLVENGQFVEEGQALAVVSKNKSLILKADVRSKYAGLLPLLSSATIRNTDKITYSLEELNGKILSFGKSLNNDNFQIPVSIQIDNRTGFIPGAFVEVCLKTQSEKPVTTVPVSALTEEQGIYFVYVQLAPDTFEKREVALGVTDGIRTEILSGLNKEEKIVTKGAISVKLAQLQGGVEAHTH